MTDLSWLPQNLSWKEEVACLEGLPSSEVWPRLVQLANARLDFVQTAKLDRVRGKLISTEALPAGVNPVRLAVLASSTVDHLLPSIRVGALRRGLPCETYTPAYGQYLQALLDGDAALESFQPNAILFAFDSHHLADWDARESSVTDGARRAFETIETCWRAAKQRFACTVYQQTLLPVFPALLGENEHRFAPSPAEIVRLVNAELRASADREGVHLLAVDEHAGAAGIAAWHNPVLWHRAKQEIDPRAAPLYGDLLGRLLAAEQGLSRKCLVLDLDNTLWGGVIGDDGLAGIHLGQNTALGEAYFAFQKYLLRLAGRGVILAVCSKNDESNALLPFEQHSGMVLRRSDIACFCANWQDKASNLRQIAQALHIGLDSLVFVDDNPFEREQVRCELPSVAVPELPEDPSGYAGAIASAGYFEALAVTREDRERARQYHANLERERVREGAASLGAYLRTLAMRLTSGPFTPDNLKRVAQLINKTNQFNLTTRRYSEDEVRSMANNPGILTFQFRLEDRFGDNGLICVVIGKCRGAVLELDTWLMSCRVLGRQVEQAALNVIAAAARSHGIQSLLGEYRPTEKNGLVRDHYARLRFTPASAPDGRSLWQLDLASYRPFETPIAIVSEFYAAA